MSRRPDMIITVIINTDTYYYTNDPYDAGVNILQQLRMLRMGL